VLGASGDLTGRYLLPAIARLLAAGALPDGLEVIGVDHANWDDQTFRRHADARLERHARDVPPDVRRDLCHTLTHQSGDVTDVRSLARVLRRLDGPAVIYLALPNALFSDTVRALAKVGLPSGSRISDQQRSRRATRNERCCRAVVDVSSASPSGGRRAADP